MSRQSPKPQAASSTSPSKSSLRTSSGPSRSPRAQNQGLGLLPSPSFERTASPKTVGFDDTALPGLGEDGSAVAIAEESADTVQQVQPLVPFEPFFALIHDDLTAEHYHPTVHYIFADDEEGPEIISEGVLRALGRFEVGDNGKEEGGSESADLKGASLKEHVLVLDVRLKNTTRQDETTRSEYEVMKAQSLSADWQISGCGIESAPTMSEDDGDGGLMLRIEGRGIKAEEFVGTGRESLEEMVGRYQRGLQEIRRMADMDAEIVRTED